MVRAGVWTTAAALHPRPTQCRSRSDGQTPGVDAAPAAEVELPPIVADVPSGSALPTGRQAGGATPIAEGRSAARRLDSSRIGGWVNGAGAVSARACQYRLRRAAERGVEGQACASSAWNLARTSAMASGRRSSRASHSAIRAFIAGQELRRAWPGAGFVAPWTRQAVNGSSPFGCRRALFGSAGGSSSNGVDLGAERQTFA